MTVDGSQSFDRAAGYYDDTRTTDPTTLARILELLRTRVAGLGRVLEIGVGTGQLAIPLAAPGVPVVGVDLSAAMMARLRAKPGGAAVRLVRGDATRLPFADGSFGGAYARWVLHLIPDWAVAIAELHRVVIREGAVAIEPGGETGVFGEIYMRFVEVLGDRARSPGMDPIDRDAELDRAMASVGRALVDVVEVTYERRIRLAEHLDRIPAKEFSWTWRVPDEDLRAALPQVRAWVAERWDLDAPQPPSPTRWRVYGAAR